MLPPILGEYQTPPHDFLCQTSWQLLAVQPPRWPLYAWTPPSSRAQDRSLKVALKPSQSASQQNGPFQTKRHYQRKLWGFLQRFPHDGGVAPEIQSNTNRPRNSLVCRPSGAKKKKKCYQETKVSGNTVYLDSSQFEEIYSRCCDFTFGFHMQSNCGLNLHSVRESFRFKICYHLPILCSSTVFPHSAL